MASDGSDDGHRSRRHRRDGRDDRDDCGDRDNRRHRARREDDGGADGTSGAPERRQGSRDRSRRRHRRSRSPAHKEHRRSDRSRDRRDRDRDRDNDRSHRRDRDPERDGRSSCRNRNERSNRVGSQDDEDRSRRERKRRRSRDDGDRRRHRKEKDEENAEARAIENSPPNRGEEEAPRPPVRRNGPLPSQADSFAIMDAIANGEAPPVAKEQPNYGVSGVLAAASNSVRQADGTVITLKYHEPPEARKPPARDDWRLFVFKGDGDLADTVPLSSRSCWLVGRDAAVTDLLAEHPSVSKQHAVLQFRHVERRDEYGDRVGGVKPYLIDLESANGTVLNGDRVPASRYLELRHKDVVKLGLSSREYVVMLAPKD